MRIATRDLPAYVAMTDPKGLPQFAEQHWTSGWLPSIYEGIEVRPTKPRVLSLDPAEQLRGDPQARQIEFPQSLNPEHLENYPGELDLLDLEALDRLCAAGHFVTQSPAP